MKLYEKIEFITPERAQKLLDNFIPNRPKKHNKLKIYTKQMRDGTFLNIGFWNGGSRLGCDEILGNRGCFPQVRVHSCLVRKRCLENFVNSLKM